MLGGLVSLMTTSVGGFVALKAARMEHRNWWNPLRSVSLDFAIGMMIAAAAFSLIGPAIEASLLSHHELQILAVVLIGILFIQLLGKMITLKNGQEKNRNYIFLIAILLHNFPEGLAAGLGESELIWAIGIQNVPEGFVTMVSFVAMGLSPLVAFASTVASGVIEMLGALTSEYLSGVLQFKPEIMAFAGGAMMSAASAELWEKIKEAKFKKADFFAGAMLILLL
ncbi:MAG: ZIP family metal transporter [Bdellovibrionia bacterium]